MRPSRHYDICADIQQRHQKTEARLLARIAGLEAALLAAQVPIAEPDSYTVDAVAWESFVSDWGKYVAGRLDTPFSSLREGIAAVIESAKPA